MDHARVVLDPAALPDDVEALRAIILAQQAEMAGQRELIGRLRQQLARLRRVERQGRSTFGRFSECLAAEADQLELALEYLEAEAPSPAPAEEL